MSGDELLVDDDDGLRTITINRPEVKNALTAAMRTRLCELVEEADADTATRAIIVTAVDPVFSAGVDFKEVAAGTGVGCSATNPGAALRAATTPVVCAVNGACVTGALEIALSCTFIVASERARFADTHARLDVVAAWGLTALLPSAIGVRKAAEMSITGNFVDADEALRLGLVNHVVPHDELLPFTVALAHDIAPTGAVAEVLDLYRRGDGRPLADALALEAEHAAGRTVDPAAFGAAGAAAAAAGQAVSDDSTRARVVDAAIACILDEGFYRASSNKIARRAGVTWGVIQYHFGTREALLVAVHERGLDELDRRLADAVITGDTVQTRLESFVDALWAYYRRPEFLAYMQVMLNLSHDPTTADSTRAALKSVARHVNERVPALARAVVGDRAVRRGRSNESAGSSTTSCAASPSTRSSSRPCRWSTRPPRSSMRNATSSCVSSPRRCRTESHQSRRSRNRWRAPNAQHRRHGPGTSITVT